MLLLIIRKGKHMEALHVYIVHHNGEDVECYGTLEENSNFSVICEDAEFDDVWCYGRPDGGWFTNWEDVVECLQREYPSRIIEISAV
jgi:hypothetical protein